MTVFMGSSLGASASLSLYFGIMLLAGVIFAPSAVKRDRRVIVAVALIAVFVIVGHAIEAGPWICPYQGTWLEFMCYVP